MGVYIYIAYSQDHKKLYIQYTFSDAIIMAYLFSVAMCAVYKHSW